MSIYISVPLLSYLVKNFMKMASLTEYVHMLKNIVLLISNTRKILGQNITEQAESEQGHT